MNVTLRRVMVFVGDVEKCADWYAASFGLRPLAEGHVPGVWREVVVGDGVTLAFHQAYDDSGPVKRATGGPGNPHKIVLCVDDLQKARSELTAKGVEMLEIQGDGAGARCDGFDCERHRFQLVSA